MAVVMCCAVFTTLCRALRSAAVALPYHIVVQQLKMLSTEESRSYTRAVVAG